MLKLLREHLTPVPVPQSEWIGIASPADKGDLALSLYLYAVHPNDEVRRNEPIPVGSGQLQMPPMPLDLHYLLTAHSNAQIQSRNLDEHRILGKAMQVLYDHPVLRAPYLEGSLLDNNEECRITLDNLGPEQMAQVWSFRDIPPKLSLSYKLGPVYLDSTRIRTTTRVVEKEIRFRQKGAGQP